MPVGTALATLLPVGAKVAVGGARRAGACVRPRRRRSGRPAPAGRRRAAPCPPPPARPPAAVGANRLRVSPLARRTAEQFGVDLATVTGSGPRCDHEGRRRGARRGRPSRRGGGAPPPRPSRGDRQAAMRDAIAALMARSKREIPHYYLQRRST